MQFYSSNARWYKRVANLLCMFSFKSCRRTVTATETAARCGQHDGVSIALAFRTCNPSKQATPRTEASRRDGRHQRASLVHRTPDGGTTRRRAQLYNYVILTLTSSLRPDSTYKWVAKFESQWNLTTHNHHLLLLRFCVRTYHRTSEENSESTKVSSIYGSQQ